MPHTERDPLPGAPLRRRAVPRVRVVLSLFALLGIGVYGTGATLTESGSVAATFSTGNLDLALSANGQTVSAGYLIPESSADALYPGGAGVLTELVVHNVGQIPLRVSALAFDATRAAGLAATDAQASPDAGLTALRGELLVAAAFDQVCDVTSMAPLAGSSHVFGQSAALAMTSPIVAPQGTLAVCVRVFVPLIRAPHATIDQNDTPTLSIRLDAEQATL
ncbi:hypothetical protein D6T64_18240 [Cryobacterium melibiosiphilum]|uniref:Uncharacterized protein n=1 Tax=Cryobacterium melibiosiphilum TaxID=995039 RepID=A0A3A5MIC3_9MICO|nr:hypothetical protein [Cryobacterium melibiosiphilum]RJT86206.1 hypothetical protein D6T64_18240 [Cryobacterium melibiosiphilum]